MSDAGIDQSGLYKARIMAGVMNVITDESLAEGQSGDKTAYIVATDVCDALISVIASLIDTGPTCQTPKGLRETSEAFGRDLRQRVQQLRGLREATGETLWQGLIPVTQSS